MSESSYPLLVSPLQQQQLLAFAVLVGSRATGKAHAGSDWDIALQWRHDANPWDVLSATEQLRSSLARAVSSDASRIDLIDLRRANLAMKASAAEDGVLLLALDAMAWEHFLRRTWRELEDHYWEQSHAA